MTLGNESVAGGIPPLPKGLYYAATLAHNAVEQGKPEGERASGFGPGDQTRLKDRMNREQRSYFAAADRQILGVIVRRALALPEGQRIAAIDAVFKGLSAEQVAGLVIAYEPVWAIGTGEVATPADAQEVCGAIRKEVAALYDEATAEAVRIQYGGSVKSGNVVQIMDQPDIDGCLVGGASLQPEEFAAIVRFYQL